MSRKMSVSLYAFVLCACLCRDHNFAFSATTLSKNKKNSSDQQSAATDFGDDGDDGQYNPSYDNYADQDEENYIPFQWKVEIIKREYDDYVLPDGTVYRVPHGAIPPYRYKGDAPYNVPYTVFKGKGHSETIYGEPKLAETFDTQTLELLLQQWYRNEAWLREYMEYPDYMDGYGTGQGAYEGYDASSVNRKLLPSKRDQQTTSTVPVSTSNLPPRRNSKNYKKMRDGNAGLDIASRQTTSRPTETHYENFKEKEPMQYDDNPALVYQYYPMTAENIAKRRNKQAYQARSSLTPSRQIPQRLEFKKHSSSSRYDPRRSEIAAASVPRYRTTKVETETTSNVDTGSRKKNSGYVNLPFGHSLNKPTLRPR